MTDEMAREILRYFMEILPMDEPGGSFPSHPEDCFVGGRDTDSLVYGVVSLERELWGGWPSGGWTEAHYRQAFEVLKELVGAR